MAIKVVCDACSKESPDERGYYVANHWITLGLKRPFRLGKFSLDSKLTICNECFGQLRERFNELGVSTHDAEVALDGLP